MQSGSMKGRLYLNMTNPVRRQLAVRIVYRKNRRETKTTAFVEDLEIVKKHLISDGFEIVSIGEPFEQEVIDL